MVHFTLRWTMEQKQAWSIKKCRRTTVRQVATSPVFLSLALGGNGFYQGLFQSLTSVSHHHWLVDSHHKNVSHPWLLSTIDSYHKSVYPLFIHIRSETDRTKSGTSRMMTPFQNCLNTTPKLAIQEVSNNLMLPLRSSNSNVERWTNKRLHLHSNLINWVCIICLT